MLVLSAEDYTKEEAFTLYNKEYEVEIDSIEESLARFGFAPDYIEDRDDFKGEPIWYTGARSGKGSKKVWVVRKWKYKK